MVGDTNACPYVIIGVRIDLFVKGIKSLQFSKSKGFIGAQHTSLVLVRPCVKCWELSFKFKILRLQLLIVGTEGNPKEHSLEKRHDIPMRV
jgi:hypothetical protein